MLMRLLILLLRQVFSSQATEQLQELIFKLAITDAISNLEYKIDFLHKVSAQLGFNVMNKYGKGIN
jgi:hypothetical protein